MNTGDLGDGAEESIPSRDQHIQGLLGGDSRAYLGN